MRPPLLLLLAIIVVPVVAAPARAGVAADDVDFVYLEPLLGAEMLRLRTASLANLSHHGDALGDTRTSTSLSVGATAGLRLGALRLSLLFQRGTHTTDAGRAPTDAVADKVFGEIGFHAWLVDGLAITPHFAFGYASLHADAMPEDLSGFGGKAGAGLDLYPAAAFSIGLRADFDAQLYRGAATTSVAYGFTLAASMGVHL